MVGITIAWRKSLTIYMAHLSVAQKFVAASDNSITYIKDYAAQC